MTSPAGSPKGFIGPVRHVAVFAGRGDSVRIISVRIISVRKATKREALQYVESQA